MQESAVSSHAEADLPDYSDAFSVYGKQHRLRMVQLRENADRLHVERPETRRNETGGGKQQTETGAGLFEIPSDVIHLSLLVIFVQGFIFFKQLRFFARQVLLAEARNAEKKHSDHKVNEE